MAMPVKRSQTLGLLGLVSINVVPHFSEMKGWVIAIVISVIFWRLAAEFERIQLPGRIFRWVIYFSGFIGVVLSYGTVLGQEAGVAILVLASGLKLLETVDYRDFMIVLILCFVLLMAKLLETQTATMTFFMLADVFVIFFMMYKLHIVGHGDRTQFKEAMRQTGRLFLWAGPVLILLFVFFPRLSARFIPNPARSEVGLGLNDELNPGDIAELVQTDRLVFKARFTEGGPPPMQNLYWRGGISAISDGMRWHNKHSDHNPRPAKFVRSFTTSFKQQIVVEPGMDRWLYAFDIPQRVIFSEYRFQKIVEATTGDAFALTKAFPSRLTYEALSHPVAQFRGVTEEQLAPYLQLPDRNEPRSIRLLENLKLNASSEDELPGLVMKYFAEKEYVYTLKPGRMSSRSIDEFLFEKRRGFCSHYAATFATLMRLAGIPSRVVWGFHGGAYNNFDGFYSVSTRDAHAWTEVWSNKQRRWIRYDPTTVIAPARINLGGQAFFQSGVTEISDENRNIDFSRLLNRTAWMNLKLAFEAITTSWTLFLMQYDLEFQQEFFKKLGFGEISPLQMFLVALTGTLFSFIWMMLRGRKVSEKKDETEKVYSQFCSVMKKLGLQRGLAEGPVAFGRRCVGQVPTLERAIDTFITSYICVRYRGEEQGLDNLISDLEDLKRAVSKFGKESRKYGVNAY